MSTELEPLTDAEQDRLDALFNAGAARVEALDEHWVHGADEGLSYCYECCKKEVAALMEKEPDGEYLVDGGWGSEGDSTPFCETCGAMLHNTLTMYGCATELAHFTDDGFNPESDMDCYFMERVISSAGWHFHDYEHEPEYKKQEQREFYAELYALGRAILAKLPKEENPPVTS
jgi:hypothetical protein